MQTINNINAKPQNVPKYLTVKRILLDRISSRFYEPTQKLPTDSELAAELGVAPMTARRALQELVSHGLVERSRGRGKGSFLTADAPVCAANHQGTERRLTRLAVLHRQEWASLRSAPVYFQTFLEIQNACVKRGASLEFLPVADGTTSADLARMMHDSGCQALIVMEWHQPSELVALQAMGVPVVVAGPYQETVPLSYVAPNDFLGAYLATRHLIELGHSRIGLLAHRQFSRVSAERRAGWQMAGAIDNGAVRKLSYHAGKAAIGGGLVFSEVKAELLAQFKQRLPPSALFARDGLFAYAAIQALAELGIKCPDDISITCVGRYYEGVFDMPHITSAQSVEGDLGREVVRLATELVNGRRTGPLGIVLPMQMVEGETTQVVHISNKK